MPPVSRQPGLPGRGLGNRLMLVSGRQSNKGLVIIMKISHALLLTAGFGLLATGAFAQQTTNGTHKDAGSGTVASESGKPSPLANPKVKGDKSTIQGDKWATTEQKSGAE